MTRPASLSASLVASAALHVLALGVLVAAVGPTVHPPFIIPVSLVTRAGGGPPGGGGAASPAADPPRAAPAEAAPPTIVAKAVRPQPAVHPHPAPAPAAPESGHAPDQQVAAVGGPGGGGGGEGGGAGGGNGAGDGSGGARVAYGSNPLPPYPMVARRLGKEGVVLLEVLVEPDGSAADVRVVRSCGFAPLDDSAVTTVRERWRFIPARRGTTPIESRVTVPIRFRLDGESDAG
jgi:protein TonB